MSLSTAGVLLPPFGKQVHNHYKRIEHEMEVQQRQHLAQQQQEVRACVCACASVSGWDGSEQSVGRLPGLLLSAPPC